MTASTLPLYDPTDYGNKPGEGPLRIGGQPATVDLSPRAAENLPSTESAAARRQKPALELVRDLAAGAEQVRARSTLYLPMAPGEKTANYLTRLARSVFHNFFRRTVEGLVGLVFRKDIVLGDDVPAKLVEQWEDIDQCGTHGDVFCRDLFEDSLIAGHAGIFVEFPKTPAGAGARPTLAEEAPLRPYWLHIKKDDIVSWRTGWVGGREVLSQLVLRETRLAPVGDYGEQSKTYHRVLRRTVPPEPPRVSFQLLEILPDKAVVVLDEGLYPTQEDIPFAVVTTSGYLAMLESVPPLLDVAYLNVAHYQQWSDYATNLHMTCVPILFGAGVQSRSDDAQEVTVGPNSGVFTDDPNGKLQYVSHDGAALGACQRALEDLKSDMGTLGLAMLAPQKRVAETAEAKRMDKAVSDSELAVAARGLQDAIEQALIYHARYLGLDVGGSATVNRDFEGLLMEPEVMSAYATLVRDAGFPARLVLEMLQQGGRIPEDADLDEIEAQIVAGLAMERAQELEAAARRAPFGAGAPEGEEEAGEEEGEEEAGGEEGATGKPELVLVVGQPYKVVQRDGAWLVVKANTGAVVKNHGRGAQAKKKALAHFRALEANVKE